MQNKGFVKVFAFTVDPCVRVLFIFFICNYLSNE